MKGFKMEFTLDEIEWVQEYLIITQTIFNISLETKKNINLLIGNGIISAESGLKTMQEISEYQEKFLNKAKEKLIGANNHE